MENVTFDLDLYPLLHQPHPAEFSENFLENVEYAGHLENFTAEKLSDITAGVEDIVQNWPKNLENCPNSIVLLGKIIKKN